MHDIGEVRWLLFDLDNTLLDFDEGAEVALKKTLFHFGYANREQELCKSYLDINHLCWAQFERGEIDVHTLKKRRFSLFVKHNDLAVDHDQMNSFYLKKLSQQTKEVDGARRLLEDVYGRFSLVLVTNGFPEVQYPRIKKSALEPYFEHIVVSEEIGYSKPSSNFFDYTFERMGYPDLHQVMIIGDSLSSDIKGGSNYGIRTCWFNQKGGSQTLDVLPDHTVESLELISDLWKK